MTPESFAERFLDNPALLNAVVCVMYDDDDDVGLDVSCKVVARKLISLEELRSVRFGWKHRISGVTTPGKYVAAMQSDGSCCIERPFVDKKHGLMFDVGNGSHENLAADLFDAYEGSGAAPYGTQGASYILKGYGYYLSSICKHFYVGKALFSKELLDADDAFILQNRIGVVESLADYHRIQSHGL